MRRPIIPFIVLVLATYTVGCSFSASSKGSSNSSGSISDSLSSPFKSSSGSSSPESYSDEVKDFTASYIKSGGDAAKLEQEVGKIADKRGVSDWENDEDTYVGIGKGLHKAGLKQAELDGYKASLADSEEQAGWIQDGYDERK